MTVKKAIVFDWDGTLFDSMTYKRANIAELFEQKYGADRNLVNTIHHQLSGLPRRKIFEAIIFELTGDILTNNDFEILSKAYTDKNVECATKASLFPDAKEILPLLTAKNLRLFVSSSASQKEIDFALDRTQTQKFFQLAFGSEEQFFKGEPHFSRFQSHTPCLKSELLFIGDDEKDRQIAKSCHVDFLQIQRDEATSREDQISSLVAIMHKLNLLL